MNAYLEKFAQFNAPQINLKEILPPCCEETRHSRLARTQENWTGRGDVRVRKFLYLAKFVRSDRPIERRGNYEFSIMTEQGLPSLWTCVLGT